jgi:hypothetical protein
MNLNEILKQIARAGCSNVLILIFSMLVSIKSFTPIKSVPMTAS